MAYTADINIVVRGQAAVNKLQKDLIELGQKLDDITKRRIGPSTALETFNAQLREATQQLNKVAAGTAAETAAIKNYVTALGNANAATERQNKLIKEEIDLREAATVGVRELADVQQYLFEKQRQLENSKLDEQAARVQAELDRQAAAAAESAAQIEKLNQRQADFTTRTDEAARAASRQTAEFIRQQRIAKEVAKINANAPAAQLLLAPAAPGAPAMGGGARSRITGPVERLGGARTQDEAATALRFAQALQQQVRPFSQIQYLYAGIASQAAKLQAIKALPDTAMLNASARGLQTIQSIEDKRIARLERIRQKLQQIAVYEASSGTMANAGFGVQGPAAPPRGVRRGPAPRTGAASDASLNAILGGAFPALFGGGPGAILGGVAGGAVGGAMGGLGGMALSIAFSAIGQQLDQMIVKLQQVGNAINALNVDTLRESFVFVNAQLQRTVDTLIEIGRYDEARLAIQEEIAAQTGTAVTAQDNIKNATNELTNAWNEVYGTVASLVGVIAIPFINGLSNVLKIFNAIIKPVNIILSTILEIFPASKVITEEEQKRLAILDETLTKQLTQLQHLGRITALEKQRTLGNTLAEKEINAQLDAQIGRQQIINDRKAVRKQFLQDNKGLNQELIDQGLKQIDIETTLLLKQQQIKDLLAQQRLEIERNNDKYQQAADTVQRQRDALDRSNAIAQSRFSAEAALNDLYGAQLQRQYELARTERQRFDIAIKQFYQQVAAADIEYRQAKVNNELLIQKAQLEYKLVELKYQQIEAEKALGIAQATARGNTAEQIQAIAGAYDKALAIQTEIIQASRDQVSATAQIAKNQDQIAAAVYQTRLIQAESQLAQRLASKEIGLSKEQADRLAGSLAVGVMQAGRMQSALVNVSNAAANAAANIARATGQSYVVTQRTEKTTATGKVMTARYQYADGRVGSAYIKAHYAKGGYVSSPTVAMIGEGGQGEYVVPESKAAAFAMNYMLGARGAGAIDGNAAPPAINIQTGPVMQQGGQNYVTIQDMEAGLQAVADTILNNSRSYSSRRFAGVS